MGEIESPGGVFDPGAYRSGEAENPGLSLIHHLQHAAGYTQRGGCSRSLQRIRQYSSQRDPILTGAVSALGIFKGAVAAFVTTPLDVAKTRIMLAKAGSATAGGNIPVVLCDVWRSKGLPGLFAGSVPRMAFISVGGFIFLGAYEKVRRALL